MVEAALAIPRKAQRMRRRRMGWVFVIDWVKGDGSFGLGRLELVIF